MITAYFIGGPLHGECRTLPEPIPVFECLKPHQSHIHIFNGECDVSMPSLMEWDTVKYRRSSRSFLYGQIDWYYQHIPELPKEDKVKFRSPRSAMKEQSVKIKGYGLYGEYYDLEFRGHLDVQVEDLRKYVQVEFLDGFPATGVLIIGR